MDEIAAVPAGAPAVRRASRRTSSSGSPARRRPAPSPRARSIFAQGAAPADERVDRLLGRGRARRPRPRARPARPGRAVRLLVDAGRAADGLRRARRTGRRRATGSRATRPRRCSPAREALRHVTRTLLGRPVGRARARRGRGRTGRAAGRRAPARARPCAASRTRRSATVAQRMTEARARRAPSSSCATGRSGSSPTATCARGWSPPACGPTRPCREAMSAPAYTVAGGPPRRRGALEMLDRGVRHFPVLSRDRRAARRRRRRRPRRRRAPHAVPAPHRDRRRGRRRGSSRSSPATCGRPSSRCTTRASRPTTSAAIISVVTDALDRRLIDLAVADEGEPPAPFAWLALGQRRAPRGASRAPTSTARSPGTATTATRRARDYVARVGRARARRPRRVRPARPTRRARPPSHRLFARSLDAWGEAIDSLVRRADPGEGADPRLDRRRQPAGAGASAGPRRSPSTSGPPAAARAPAPDGALRARPTVRRPASCATSSSSTPASTRAGSTSSTAGCCRSPTSPAGPAWPPARRRSRPASACARPREAGVAHRRRRARPRGGVRARRRAAPRPPGRADPRRGGRPTTTSARGADAADAQLPQGRLPRRRRRAAADRHRAPYGVA